MARYAHFIIGPAGSGKSTFCSCLYEHCIALKRKINIVNLDPAAVFFSYPVSLDIRHLITLEDVMEALRLGPNGGLMYCMEYFEDNLDHWFNKEITNYGEGDYLLIDCPGQIELFSHISVFRSLTDYLQKDGWKVGTVFALDAHFILENVKFIFAAMQVMSAMALLELGQINLLTKIDLSTAKCSVSRFLCPDTPALVSDLTDSLGPRFRKMNQELSRVIDEYSLVRFWPLDLTSDESITSVLSRMDCILQFGDEEEEVYYRHRDD
eukprot:gnl/MRDRNA2_/MRDRNA2_82555_c0_seq2.p1 gnl/MRDRNA2_/MRDRNA2_82555_c0~~gnl/MRDRNA2_/MRDRNA2_82555_c0_seq2.p1  ORF type:complete len:266 (+),score=4.49 gnl/MRDRNA2_/MRDRNA2_82555_c0_seq2:92-889(+)